MGFSNPTTYRYRQLLLDWHGNLAELLQPSTKSWNIPLSFSSKLSRGIFVLPRSPASTDSIVATMHRPIVPGGDLRTDQGDQRTLKKALSNSIMIFPLCRFLMIFLTQAERKHRPNSGKLLLVILECRSKGRIRRGIFICSQPEEASCDVRYTALNVRSLVIRQRAVFSQTMVRTGATFTGNTAVRRGSGKLSTLCVALLHEFPACTPKYPVRPTCDLAAS